MPVKAATRKSTMIPPLRPDFPDQTGFSKNMAVGSPRTIKRHLERVNRHPIGSIAPL